MEQQKNKTELWKEQVRAFAFPRWDELPEIDLYMDQVVSYLSQKLSVFYDIPETEEEENRSITSTMINNYVKQKIIAPPVKKRYDRSRLAALLMLFCVKQVLSIGESSDFISVCLTDSTPKEGYDRFCTVFEAALHRTADADASSAKIDIFSGSDPVLTAAAVAFSSKNYAEKLIETAKDARNAAEAEEQANTEGKKDEDQK